MKIPSSTYRIQFRDGMTFDRAATLVPYLKRLGISHLYASPIFTATSGSTHGYDVTDANEFDPVLGGREGFDRMSQALQQHGLGLILDIVPNHMASSLENPWWRDVVEHGEDSRYAHYFDIDWSRRLTLPFLGDTFEKVLEAGDLSIKADPDTGKPALAYYDTCYPLKPSTYDGREQAVLSMTAKAEIAALHDQQPWRLMSWRDAPRELSYRRFFEITGLVGLRVEDPEVFADAHRLVLDLVREGRVDGLRIDHVDGLADPKAYLEQLREAAGPDTYIVVEKILGEGEQLPDDWPISGTTGYEFIGALSNALVDGSKTDALTHVYEAVSGRQTDPMEDLRDAKLSMANNNFEGEVAALQKLALALHEVEDDSSAIDADTMHNALRELLVAFPVYRTYGTADGMPEADKTRLGAIVSSVESGPHAPDKEALAFIRRILLGDVGAEQADKASLFRTRFQQLTGPLMAKSLEDTLFFRHHRLLALNEVGSEAAPPAASLPRGDAHPPQAPAPRALGNLHARYQARRGCPRPPLYPQRGAGDLGRSRRPLARHERIAGGHTEGRTCAGTGHGMDALPGAGRRMADGPASGRHGRTEGSRRAVSRLCRKGTARGQAEDELERGERTLRNGRQGLCRPPS